VVDWHSQSIRIEAEFWAYSIAFPNLAGDRAWLRKINNVVVSSAQQWSGRDGLRDRFDSRAVINTTFTSGHAEYDRCPIASQKNEKRNADQLFTGRRVSNCVLLLGSGESASRARAALESARGEGFEPVRAVLDGPDGETPEESVERLRSLVQNERVQIVCLVPEEHELPRLLAFGVALRESGAAVYWAGTAARLAPLGPESRIGPLDAVLLYAPTRGLGLRARKRMTDLFLSLLVAPWRWRGLGAYLRAHEERLAPGTAWRLVWSGERSWIGRSRYESDRWAGVPSWARAALQTLRPGVVSPGLSNGAESDRVTRLESELAYLSRFSLTEDLRLFLHATRAEPRS
jgi:hypothetical protein